MKLFKSIVFFNAMIVTLATIALIPQWGTSQPDPKTKPPDRIKKHPRGYIQPKPQVIKERIRVSNNLHADKLKALPVITAPTWDIVANGYGPAINDQGQCGDCYINSGCNAAASGLMVAGVVPKGSGFQCSFQYFLDCQNVGGCGGGDEYQVAQIISQSGCPSAAQYAGQGQSPGNCQSTAAMTLYGVGGQLVYCDSSGNSGVASTQSIKNAIAAYGYVSVAVAANDDWDNYAGGTAILAGPADPNGINHAIGLMGWRTQGTTTIWKAQNSWGTSWGNAGYCWVQEGAYSIGTEAFSFVVAAQPIPPTPPVPPTPPIPPGPIPPVPGTTTISITSPLVTGGSLTLEGLPVGTTAWLAAAPQVTAKGALLPSTPITTPDRMTALEANQREMMTVILDLQKQLKASTKP
jgi:hypothetical protein